VNKSIHDEIKNHFMVNGISIFEKRKILFYVLLTKLFIGCL